MAMASTPVQRAGSWTTEWRFGGAKGQKQRCTFGTEKLAIRAKELAEAHRHRITRAEVEDIILGISAIARKSGLPTVREWADTWLGSRTRISPGQRGRYRSQLDRVILPAIGDLHLDEVDGTHVVNILKSLRGRDGGAASPATCTRYFTAMYSLFQYAVREGKIDDNPAGRTDFVRDLIAHDDAGDEGDDHVYLSKRDYQLIWDHMAPEGRPVIDLLSGTGARWSEATAIAIGVTRVGPKERAVRIHRAWKQDDKGRWYLGSTKGRTKRRVTIGLRTAAAVAPLLVDDAERIRPDDELLLTAPRGGRLSHSNFNTRFWEPAVDAAMRCDRHPPAVAADNGPPLDERGRWRRRAVSTCGCTARLRQRPTLHDLRHTHVAWQIAAGHPIAAISQRIGHRTTEITERVYAGILPEIQQAMGDVVDDLFSEDVATAGGDDRAGG
jgi:integrase